MNHIMTFVHRNISCFITMSGRVPMEKSNEIFSEVRRLMIEYSNMHYVLSHTLTPISKRLFAYNRLDVNSNFMINCGEDQAWNSMIIWWLRYLSLARIRFSFVTYLGVLYSRIVTFESPVGSAHLTREAFLCYDIPSSTICIKCVPLIRIRQHTFFYFLFVTIEVYLDLSFLSKANKCTPQRQQQTDPST